MNLRVILEPLRRIVRLLAEGICTAQSSDSFLSFVGARECQKLRFQYIW